MSLIAQLIRPAGGIANAQSATPSQDGDIDGFRSPAGSDALHSGLPVVWHVIVDIPYAADSSRRTGLTLSGAAANLEQQAARVRNAERILAILGEDDGADGASDWLTTVSPRGVRAERDGGSFEQLEQRLHDEGFTADDFTIGVEYARSWGML